LCISFGKAYDAIGRICRRIIGENVESGAAYPIAACGSWVYNLLSGVGTYRSMYCLLLQNATFERVVLSLILILQVLLYLRTVRFERTIKCDRAASTIGPQVSHPLEKDCGHAELVYSRVDGAESHVSGRDSHIEGADVSSSAPNCSESSVALKPMLPVLSQSRNGMSVARDLSVQTPDWRGLSVGVNSRPGQTRRTVVQSYPNGFAFPLSNEAITTKFRSRDAVSSTNRTEERRVLYSPSTAIRLRRSRLQTFRKNVRRHTINSNGWESG